MFCTIMSTLMAASPRVLKIRPATPGLSGTPTEGDLGLIFVEGDAADDDVFHASGFLFHDRSWVIVQAGADFEDDAEFLGELDRARLHDLGPEAGQFQHFVVADLLHLPRFGDDARIGGVDAVDVGVDLAEIGFEGGGQGDGGEVGAAAAEGGDVAFGAAGPGNRRR